MIIKTVIFKRSKDSKTEVCIEFEGPSIIDKNGKLVPQAIWNAKDITGIQIDLQPILDSLSKIEWNL